MESHYIQTPDCDPEIRLYQYCPYCGKELKPHQCEVTYIMNDECPDCGGDRNSPPLTGCRPYSHYGTYCFSEVING